MTGPDTLHFFYFMCLYIFFKRSLEHNLGKCTEYLITNYNRELTNECEVSGTL